MLCVATVGRNNIFIQNDIGISSSGILVMDASRTDPSSVSKRSSDLQIGLTIDELKKAVDFQHGHTQSIVESLESLHVTGNMVRSAFAISTTGHNSHSKTLQLPKILRDHPCERCPWTPRKISFESKCPISKVLRKATEKQNERERFWKRRRGEFQQRFNPKPQRGRKMTLPKLESNALFSHMKQNYDSFEAQENEKKGRRKVFSRITRKGRLSMIN